jgi:hypothetical protein
MTAYAKRAQDYLAKALANCLCLCFAFVAFGLYELSQPTTYQAPALKVIAYGPPSGLPPPPDVTLPCARLGEVTRRRVVLKSGSEETPKTCGLGPG